MQEGFDIEQWVTKVQKERPFIDLLVSELQHYGAITEPNTDSHDVASLHYLVHFSFPIKTVDVVVTIGIALMDHQSASDLVIETMTTLPETHCRQGFGSQAVSKLQHWARTNQFKEVRAVQVSGKENEDFWRKHSFDKAPGHNPCNDFVWKP